MTEAPSFLIRAGNGRIKVLRLVVIDGATQPCAYTVALNQAMCRVCGCTENYACVGGCGWANAAQTLCTRCLEKELLP